MLNIPQCIGQASPPRKNFSVPNGKVAKVEKTWAKSGVRETEWDRGKCL